MKPEAATLALPRAKRLLQVASSLPLGQRLGRVRGYNGLVIRAQGPDACIGELCLITLAERNEQVLPWQHDIEGATRLPSEMKQVLAEVIGFDSGDVLLLPFGDVEGVTVDSVITGTNKVLEVSLSMQLLGRVVDAFARPIDTEPGLVSEQDVLSWVLPERMDSSRRSTKSAPINPLDRKPISERLETGVSALDLFLPLGMGQRVGIFAGSGVGKSTLLGMCAKGVQTDVSVIVLVGERGREVREFIEHSLGEEGMRRAVVVVATAEEPALMRVQAVKTAHTIAEYFSRQGKSVLLMVDSITRYAMAQREIGLAAGEPPTYRGYTPSVFSELPKLAERCGNFMARGSITAIYSVLVEGDDMNDPISDHMRAILDGHIVLDRKIAAQGQLPAVDVLRSISRLESALCTPIERQQASSARELMARFEECKDLIEMGAYQAGSNAAIDQAIEFMPKLRKLLSQPADLRRGFTESLSELARILGSAPNPSVGPQSISGQSLGHADRALKTNFAKLTPEPSKQGLRE
jgi:flagellum-specific ATP synthase